MKNRQWRSYIKKNKYSECLLITAINAHYCLTGNRILQNSKEYEDLVDLCGARYGSATDIQKVHKKLGIKTVWTGGSLIQLRIDYAKNNTPTLPLPIAWTNWSYEHGFHSTLIVAASKGKLRVTNFYKIADKNGWIEEGDTYKYETFNTAKCMSDYSLFALVGDQSHKALTRKSKKDRKKFFETYIKFYQNRLEEIENK